MILEELFFVEKGKGAYREQLEIGNTPLVSAKNTNNGIIADVDIEATFKAPAITVERVTGSAFVQLSDFATVPDDITVLIPRKKLSLKKLFYIASQLNHKKWRFGFSRKATPTRLKKLDIDMSYFNENFNFNFSTLIPQQIKKKSIKHNHKFKEFFLNELFDEVGHGDFHVSSSLKEGNIPFISCVTVNNGNLGYFDIPKNMTYQHAMTITCDGDRPLTPFYHPYRFNAQDNVMIYKPKKESSLYSIFFVMVQLRKMLWKFSYGRKCYLNKLRRIKVSLPINNGGTLDHEYMKNLAMNCYGWNMVEKEFNC